MTASELLAEIYASLPTVECQRKCGPAYCGAILAYPTERLRMEQAGFPIRLTVSSTGNCSYFDVAANACRVHSVRPLICRLFGAAVDPRMACPFGCVSTGKITNEQVQHWISQLEALDGKPICADGRVADLLGV